MGKEKRKYTRVTGTQEGITTASPLLKSPFGHLGHLRGDKDDGYAEEAAHQEEVGADFKFFSPKMPS